jgi:RimJ/RimL family protein N-acetyltransferase
MGRLAELYDDAAKNARLARLITEGIDEEGNVSIDADGLDLSPEEQVWLGSLFLAYEQIYIATNALSKESQRVWRIYLKNNLNKPHIRAAFVRDATNSLDYHKDFWRFVRGHPTATGGHHEAGAIPPRFFSDLGGQKSKPKSPVGTIVAKPIVQSDVVAWQAIYRDPQVRKQMYAAPHDNADRLWDYLRERRFFSVFSGDRLLGGFNLYDIDGTRASFGIVFSTEARGTGLGMELMRLLKEEAKNMGVLTLRADVYSDNAPCIHLLEKAEFRRFVWFETNID